jgi:hypothetical protein
MAKVQEAKEIPTVKELDIPVVPDKKTFPPRVLIALLGTFLACCAAVLYVLGYANWTAIDAQEPGKQFATEVWLQLKSYRQWIFRNGAGTQDYNDTRSLDLRSADDKDSRERDERS